MQSAKSQEIPTRRRFLAALAAAATAIGFPRTAPAQYATHVLSRVNIPPPVRFIMPPMPNPALREFTRHVDAVLGPGNRLAKATKAYLKASKENNQRDPDLEKALQDLLYLNPLNRPRHLRPIVKIDGGKMHEPEEVKQKMRTVQIAYAHALARWPGSKALQHLEGIITPEDLWPEDLWNGKSAISVNIELCSLRKVCFMQQWLDWAKTQEKAVKAVAARLAKQTPPNNYVEKQIQLYRAQLYRPILKCLEHNAANLKMAIVICMKRDIWYGFVGEQKSVAYQEFGAAGYNWTKLATWLGTKDIVSNDIPILEGYPLPFYAAVMVRIGKELKQQGMSLPPDLTDPDFFPEIKATVQQAPRIQQLVASVSPGKPRAKAG